MNEDTLKGKWGQLKGDAEIWWGKKTGDPLTETHGKWTKLTGWLQEKKGIAKEEADKEIKEFLAVKNTLDTQLDEVKSEISTKWDKFSSKEIAELKGDLKDLSDKISKKYNQDEEKAMSDIKAFMGQFKDS